jgi:hypothetical protein
MSRTLPVLFTLFCNPIFFLDIMEYVVEFARGKDNEQETFLAKQSELCRFVLRLLLECTDTVSNVSLSGV